MRVLVLSNFYPPYYLGGYELGCQDVVEGLRELGHSVLVLTSRHGSGKIRCDGIHRRLHSSYDWDPRFGWTYVARLTYREVVDVRCFRSLITQYSPDVIYVWNLWSLPLSLLAAAEQSGKPVVHFVSDVHLTRWDSDPWFRLLDRRQRPSWKRVVLRTSAAAAGRLRMLTLPKWPNLRYAHFASQYLRDVFVETGFEMESAEVTHWGVSDDWFRRTPAEAEGLQLLYAGRLSAEKGVDTAIEALAHLKKRLPRAPVSLTIAGGSGPREYEEHLRGLASEFHLADCVSFLGKVDRNSVGDLYSQHNVFLLPSIWHEPFSIALVEAMACGLVPVGTLTGGTGEILQVGVTGLVFNPGDSVTCARQLEQLVEQPGLRRSLSEQARRLVAGHFRLERMVKNIEKSLLRTLALRGPSHDR